MIHQCISPENKDQDRSHEEQLHSTNPKESAFPSHFWYRAHVPQTGQMWERWMVGKLLHLEAGNLPLFKELIYKTELKEVEGKTNRLFWDVQATIKKKNYVPQLGES